MATEVLVITAKRKHVNNKAKVGRLNPTSNFDFGAKHEQQYK